MSKAAVKKLKALIGHPVAIFWPDATCEFMEVNKPMELYREATYGVLDYVDDAQIKLRMGTGLNHQRDDDSAFAVPIEQVRKLVVLEYGEVIEFTPSFRIKRRPK